MKGLQWWVFLSSLSVLQTQNHQFPHKHIGRDLLHRAKTCLSFTVPTIPVGAGRWQGLLQ